MPSKNITLSFGRVFFMPIQYNNKGEVLDFQKLILRFKLQNQFHDYSQTSQRIVISS